MVSVVTPKRNEMIVAVNINHLVVMSVIVNDNVSFHLFDVCDGSVLKDTTIG
jgi:hypothetical protein